MPHKTLKSCKQPGCPNLIEGSYFEEHNGLVAKEYNRYSRSFDHNKKYGRAWKRIRYRHAKEHPLCERCLKEGRITPIDEVRHILPVNRGGGSEESNLMSVCKSCHNKIHIELGNGHPNEFQGQGNSNV